MRFHCGVDKDIEDVLNKEICHLKVCNGHDDMSNRKTDDLIESHKNFKFYRRIRNIPPKYRGTFIRWLYRGLTFDKARIKVNDEMSYMRFMGYANCYITERI